MTKWTGKRRHHFKSVIPRDPAIKPFKRWLSANRGFYAAFLEWLIAGGYGESARMQYGVAARLALGWLDQAYWLIDPDADLDRVRTYMDTHLSAPTSKSYHKGLLKLAEYLRVRQNRPTPARPIHWEYHLATLPPWLADAVRAYVTHCQRTWRPEQKHRCTTDLLSTLARPLRGLVALGPLDAPQALTPDRWFQYVDVRLAAGIQPVTLNGELGVVRHLLQFLSEEGQPICERFLLVEPFKLGPDLPRDVPLAQLKVLAATIEQETHAEHAGRKRMGLLDRAWFLLMLHSGLRTGEVRRLQLPDLDLTARRVRIEQSKGLKDRLVYLSEATVAAFEAYLPTRGPAENSLKTVFLYRHQPLSVSYCSQRLETYGKHCGIHITPHQLRHSCATLLLNAGAPILTVQSILGHKHIDTTLGYARLYDGTVAADYYRAMAQVEQQLNLTETLPAAPMSSGQLLALVDALSNGTLNEQQREVIAKLREGVQSLASSSH